MPNNALLPLICCGMVLTAVGADYGFGQLDVSKPHRLPVETFPAVIGSWKGGPVQEVDPEVQKKLATAKIVERVYANTAPGSNGEWVDLMLLTATEDEDMHSPKACFPSQGWTLSNFQSRQVDGQPATQMTVQMDGGERQAVLYWLTGYFPPAPPRTALLRQASTWRTHLMGPHNNMSLFVRLISSDTPLGHRAIADFTASLHDPLQTLVGAPAKPFGPGNLPKHF